MAPPSVPIGIPQEIVAGDSVTWDDFSFVDSRGSFTPAAGYVLKYYIASPTGKAEVTADVFDGRWRSALTAGASADLAAVGQCEPCSLTWSARVTLAGESFTVGRGQVTLRPDPARLGSYTDPLEAELAEVKATIRGIQKSGLQAYTMHGRSYTKVDLPLLYGRQASLVSQLRRRRNGGGFTTHLVTFNAVD